jgi:hypothetical protein
MFALNATERPSECVIGRHYRHTGTPLTKVHYNILTEHLFAHLEVSLFGLIQNHVSDLSLIQNNFAKNRVGVKSSISHVASILLKALNMTTILGPFIRNIIYYQWA